MHSKLKNLSKKALSLTLTDHNISIKIPIVLLGFLLNTLLQPSTAFGQNTSVDSVEAQLYKPKLILDFALLDFPYMQRSAQTSANHRLNQLAGASGTANAGDFLRGYNSPSMRQVTAIAKDMHSTGYFLSNALWYRLVKPTNWKRRLLNRLGANATATIPDYLLTKYPLGVGWAHEEYHRNTMTLRGISSYNTMWDIGRSKGYVSHEKDEDLVRFKAKYPTEFIRMHAAGIEGEYNIIQAMQKDNFFHQTNYPNIILSILLTKHAVDYVGFASDPERGAERLRYILKNEGPDIAQRDFTGLDLNAWVYDLFRPQEPYEARGIHPSGIGIFRDRLPSDFTPEEFAYAQKVGKLQYWNFLSPHLLGISQIKVSKNFAFNFAARHYLTSFGYDLGADIFLKIKDKNILFTWHGYHNKDYFFPGVEAQLLDLPLKLSAGTLPLTLRTILWLQPKDQQFYTDKGQAGGLIYAQLRSPAGRTWQPYVEVEGKTEGWAAGNSYLKPNLTVRVGLSAYINFKPK